MHIQYAFVWSSPHTCHSVAGITLVVSVAGVKCSGISSVLTQFQNGRDNRATGAEQPCAHHPGRGWLPGVRCNGGQLCTVLLCTAACPCCRQAQEGRGQEGHAAKAVAGPAGAGRLNSC